MSSSSSNVVSTAANPNIPIEFSDYAVIDTFPKEIFLAILQHLSPKKVLSCALVSKQWHRLAKDNAIWALFSKQAFGVTHVGQNEDVLQLYKERFLNPCIGGVYASSTFSSNDASLVCSLSISANEVLFSGSSNRTINVWDVKTRTCLHTFSVYSGWVQSLTSSSDGKVLVSGHQNGAINVWDVETKDCLHTLLGHGDIVASLTLSADEKILVSSAADGIIKIWDIQKGNLLHAFDGYDEWVYSAILSADKNTLFGTQDCTIKIWDVVKKIELGALEGHVNEILSLALSTDEKMLVSGSADGIIKIWDVEKQTCSHSFRGHTGTLDSLFLSADGQRLISVGFGDRKIKIWNVATQNCLHILDSFVDEIRSFTVSADEKRLFFGTSHGTIKVWDFGASLAQVLSEIKDLFNEQTEPAIEQALERFEKMPQEVKDAVYEELRFICKPSQDAYLGWAKDAFEGQNKQSSTPEEKAQAIAQYLEKSDLST